MNRHAEAISGILFPADRGEGTQTQDTMHICRAGLHCTTLTGLTPDGRCLECRRESHRRAQAKYDKTSRGLIQTGRRNDKRDIRLAEERNAGLG